MGDDSPAWRNSTIGRPWKKRAAVVCTICNSKKVKCDLEKRRRDGKACTHCEKSGNQNRCYERMPKRLRGSRNTFQGRTDQLLSLSPSGGIATSMSQGDEVNGTTSTSHDDQVNGTRDEQVMMTEEPQSYLDIAENHRGDLDTGHLQMYRRETYEDAHNQAVARHASEAQALHNAIPPDLLHTFAETYFENCYAWCPILDRDCIFAELAQSTLLGNALALAASHVQPPILPHDGPAKYYDRAWRAFYEDEEPDALISLKAVLLFYWWAPRSTSLVHRHSSWWWTSVVIRQGQMMNMHREPPPKAQLLRQGVRRRMWWTAFARERLTALCQSKPLLIKPEDCNIPEPTLSDFASNNQEQTKAEIFVSWIKLCGIIGQIAQQLSRAVTAASPFPRQSANDLISWIRSLPRHLTLQIGHTHTSVFNKDVHQLHLPYYTAIIVLHLKHSSQPGSLPTALPPAILAASCIARILKDILARGTTRFLMPITSWYCGISFVALASASRDANLRDAAKADMDIIRLACDQLRLMWGSANVLFNGFERLQTAADTLDSELLSPVTNGLEAEEVLSPQESFDWTQYFPLVTAETSPIAAYLLRSRENNEVTGFDGLLPDATAFDLQDWFDFTNPDFAFDIDTG